MRDDPRRLRLNKSHLKSAAHKLMETNLRLPPTIKNPSTMGFRHLAHPGARGRGDVEGSANIGEVGGRFLEN